MLAVLPNAIAKHQDFVRETCDLIVLAEDEFLLHAVLGFQKVVGLGKLLDVATHALVEILLHRDGAILNGRGKHGYGGSSGLLSNVDDLVLALHHASLDCHALDCSGTFLGEHLVLQSVVGSGHFGLSVRGLEFRNLESQIVGWCTGDLLARHGMRKATDWTGQRFLTERRRRRRDV